MEGRKKGTTKELLKKIRCIQRIMKISAIDLQGLRTSDKLTGCEDDFKKAGLTILVESFSQKVQFSCRNPWIRLCK